MQWLQLLHLNPRWMMAVSSLSLPRLHTSADTRAVADASATSVIFSDTRPKNMADIRGDHVMIHQAQMTLATSSSLLSRATSVDIPSAASDSTSGVICCDTRPSTMADSQWGLVRLTPLLMVMMASMDTFRNNSFHQHLSWPGSSATYKLWSKFLLHHKNNGGIQLITGLV